MFRYFILSIFLILNCSCSKIPISPKTGRSDDILTPSQPPESKSGTIQKAWNFWAIPTSLTLAGIATITTAWFLYEKPEIRNLKKEMSIERIQLEQKKYNDFFSEAKKNGNSSHDFTFKSYGITYHENQNKRYGEYTYMNGLVDQFNFLKKYGDTFSRTPFFKNKKNSILAYTAKEMENFLDDLMTTEEATKKYPKANKEKLQKLLGEIKIYCENIISSYKQANNPFHFNSFFEDLSKMEGVFALLIPEHAMLLVLNPKNHQYLFFDPNWGLFQFPDAHTLSSELKRFFYFEGYFIEPDEALAKPLKWAGYYRLGPTQWYVLDFIDEVTEFKYDTGFGEGLCLPASAQAAKWFLEHPGQIPTRKEVGFEGLSDETWLENVKIKISPTDPEKRSKYEKIESLKKVLKDIDRMFEHAFKDIKKADSIVIKVVPLTLDR